MNDKNFFSIGAISPQKILYKVIDNKEYHLHLFRPNHPPSNNRNSCIIFFFGGGWNNGTPTQFYPHCQYFASRGMIAASAEYRVKSRDNSSPFDSVSDAKSAIRWVRQHAEELGIDSNYIAAGGGSAGGHIAAATTILKSFNDPMDNITISCKPNTLVLFNPILNTGPNGFGYNRIKNYWKDFSLLHNISDEAAPTIIFSGSEDKLVSISDIESYKNQLSHFRIQCDTYIYKGEPHGFFNYQGGHNLYFYDTLLKADLFLSSLNYLQGKPLIENTSINVISL